MIVPVVRRRVVVLGSLAAGLLGGTGAAGAAPAVPGVAVPLEIAAARCVVTVLLNGRPARMIVDTGAQVSLLSRTAAARLRLPPDEWVATTLEGLGGVLERRANVVARSATLGGAALFQREPGAGLSLSVTSLDIEWADGLLGGDVLRHYTLDLYLGGGRLVLCSPVQKVLKAGAVPLRLWRRDLLLAAVRLDGRELLALVDTGSPGSLINARGRYRLGLTPEQTRRDPAVLGSAVGGPFAAYRQRFDELVVGGLRIDYPELAMDAVPQAGYDMVLGLDVLGRQRLLLSYAGLTLGFAPASA